MNWSWVVVGLVLLSGCASSPAEQVDEVAPPVPTWKPLLGATADPLAPGPLTYKTADYDLGKTTVGGPDADHSRYEYEALIRGVITVPDGPGPFPLAVFLHGQHTTCGGADGEEGGGCVQPYRNDMGYIYLMEHLASHGIATASILAHEINNQNGAGDVGMWARGELVVDTIQALQQSEYAPRIDFSAIGLMGHSRGGEGVVTAVEVNEHRGAPHTLAAVIALAPTDFAYRAVPGIPFLTLAPYCDGDVYSLHGLRQFDQSRYTDTDAIKIQLLVMGANHNNYNTKWGKSDAGPLARGDDAPTGRHQNTHCDLSREDGGGRLTLEDTYAESIFHMGGFFRWTLLGHDGLAPYFLGAPQHQSACPGQTPSCPGATHLSVMTPGRRDMFWADANGFVGAQGVNVPDAQTCQLSGCDGNVYSSAWMADGRIVQENTYSFGFSGPWNVTDTPVLNVRVAVPTKASTTTAAGPPEMTIMFHGEKGQAAVLVDHPALFSPPALPVDPGVHALGFFNLGGAKVSANAVAVPVPEGLGHLTGVELRFSSTAPERILVADAWFNRDTASVLSPL